MIFALLLGLVSYFFYHSYRLIVPLSFLPIPFLLKSKKSVLFSSLAVLVVFAASAIFASSNQGSARFSQVAFYNNQNLNTTIKSFSDAEGPGNVFISRIFHNKLIIYSREFLRQYFTYFSPQFLLSDLGLPSGYVTPEVGLIYYTFIPFLFFSLLFYSKINPGVKLSFYLFYITIISILPAAVTYEDTPNISRSAPLILPLLIFISAGGICFYNLIKKIKYSKIILFAISGLIILEFIYFWHEYSVIARTFKPVNRNDGDKKEALFLAGNKMNYSQVYAPYEKDQLVYYLFFTNNFSKFNPDLLKNKSQEVNIDRINFINDICTMKYIQDKYDGRLPKKLLVIEGGDCPVRNPIPDSIIKRVDGTKAYNIYGFP